MKNRPHTSILNSTLIIAGLGYFIDAFDAFLYNALRVPSLREMGLDGDALTSTGLQILSLQLAGFFLGGYIWGVVGDKIGRKKALICTVLLYSLGSLGSAAAHSVTFYAMMRFLTGIGVAGETGLGAILAVETLPDHKRNWAIMFFASFGVTAIFFANLVPEFLPWRACYAVGGVAGLILLLARQRLFESGLFQDLKARLPRGSFKLLISKPGLLKRYLCTVLFALPNFCMANFLITLAPEYAKSVGVSAPIKANVALMCFFAGQFVTDISAVLVSMLFKRRKTAIALYMLGAMIATTFYLALDHPTEVRFYVLCGVMGLCSYWVLLVFTAVEQFGTNMRATLGVSALSTGRAFLVITNLLFLALRGAGLDMVPSLRCVIALIFILGVLGYAGLRETYHAGMDFVEEKA